MKIYPINECAKKVMKYIDRNEYTLRAIMLCVLCFMLGACAKSAPEPEIVTVEKVKYIDRVTMVEKPFFTEYNFSTFTRSEVEDTIRNLDKFIEVARCLNITSDNAIAEAEAIMEKAQTALENREYKMNYSQDDLNLLAWIIFIEAGDNSCDDLEQQLVGQVIMNRKAMGGIGGRLSNPTIADVINERGQYYIAIKRGYNITPWNIDLSNVTEKCYRNAQAVLDGEVDCPSNVVFQATFKQGSGTYMSFYHPYYNNTTYFCYL